jgi:hypothetical protein
MSSDSEKIIRDLIDNAEEFTPTDEASDRHNSARRVDTERNLTQTDLLIQLASDAAPFHTPEGTGYVDVDINGYRETWAIRSETCREWLSQLYFEETDRAANPESLKAAISWLEAQAKFKGPERNVHVRVARHEGNVYLDLGDRDWRAAEITPEGWSIIDRPPVRFRRPPGMKPLPIPSERGSISALKPFLNVSASDFVLVVAYLLSALRGQGPYWVLALSGEQGSSKTTFCKFVRAIIDPHAAPLRTLPRDERDLYIAAANGHVLAFDNVSVLKPWQSDALCRVATGGSQGTRRLYTDQDEALISAQNPVILNGIEEVVARQDLADRTIHLTLDPISEDCRLPEDELWARFNEELPGILGRLLDAMVYGLTNYRNIAPKGLARMADCAKFVMACEPALWPIGTFEEAFAQNRDEGVQLAIEADPVAAAIVELATHKVQTMQTMQTINSNLPPAEELMIFGGTATDLNKQLRGYGDEFVSKSRHWPKVPQALSGRLRRMAPALRKSGIRIERDRLGRPGTKLMYLYVHIKRFMKRSHTEGEVYAEYEICEESEVELASEDHDATSDASPAVSISSSASSADTPKTPAPEQTKPKKGILVPIPKPKKPTSGA